jgi:hypothetical protein
MFPSELNGTNTIPFCIFRETLLERKDMNANENERLSNITFKHKLLLLYISKSL